jgi:hypothetical protein
MNGLSQSLWSAPGIASAPGPDRHHRRLCDDTKTAPQYFDLLKYEFRDQKTIHVCRAPHCGANAAEVIELAKGMKPTEPEPGDATFVLVDSDTNPDVQALRSACIEAGVRLSLSKPCYEVWTLAHLEDTGQAFLDCGAVVRRVKAKWRREFGQSFNRKSQADYSKIMPRRGEAIRRSRQRNATNSQSWTEVWQAVALIVAPPIG